MINLKELKSYIGDIAKEKNIDKKVVIGALENAYKSFARKKINMIATMEASYDDATDEMHIFQFKKVVTDVKNAALEISFKEAKTMDSNIELDDDLGIDITPQLVFLRNDITLIRQMFMTAVQKEIKEKMVTEFSTRKGELVSGIVKKVDYKFYLIDLGTTEAYLNKDQVIGNESFQVKDKIQAVLTNVEATPKGAEIHLSRTTPYMILKLLEQEIPEVGDGLITVTKIVREPGLRTKILVTSNESGLNPVQAIIGAKGYKIQNIINQINGERVNVFQDPQQSGLSQKEFCTELLKPIPLEQIVNYGDKLLISVATDDVGKVLGARAANLKTTASLLNKAILIISTDKLKEHQEKTKKEYEKVTNDLVAQNLVNNHLYTDESLNNFSASLPKALGLTSEEVAKLLKDVSEAKLSLEELPVEASASPKEGNVLKSDSSTKKSQDAEKRLREEIRASLNIK